MYTKFLLGMSKRRQPSRLVVLSRSSMCRKGSGEDAVSVEETGGVRVERTA